MRVALLTLLVGVSTLASAQAPATASIDSNQVWQMQDSATTAGLRGIDSVDGTVAWATGTGGTVLKTTDGGAHWMRCATPDAATDGATLDFRGVQAEDGYFAFVMASGPGQKSRLYRTTDGCKTWALLAKNKDEKGFWDGVVLQREYFGYLSVRDVGVLIGDAVHGRFETRRGLIQNIQITDSAGCEARDKESAFAASNSSIIDLGPEYLLGTGGRGGGRLLIAPRLNAGESTNPCEAVEIPIKKGSESSGVFSIDLRDMKHLIAVGGDYTKPNDSNGTAAYTNGDWFHWIASTTPPHGYRSAVQWSESLKLWIAAGTNGSDLSRDDGRTWQPLDDGNWNALSLPFAVGPSGRIARLNPSALPPASNP